MKLHSFRKILSDGDNYTPVFILPYLYPIVYNIISTLHLPNLPYDIFSFKVQKNHFYFQNIVF